MYLDPTPENVDKARAFVARKWRERSVEMGREPPADLSGSCKFAALFAAALFGGEISGNVDHVHVRLPDGPVLDLNHDATDVRRLPDPYRHDARFCRCREFRASLRSCEPRVAAWLAEFRAI